MSDSDLLEREPQTLAYIGLGSNIGDRYQFLTDAIDRLIRHPHISLAGTSFIYETEPVGYVDQDAFLNMVIAITTSLGPEGLLNVMQDVERQLGRKREIRWGPRTIDLDLLLFEGCEQDRPELILPHPRMRERAFVLIPLIDIMAEREPVRADVYRKLLEQAEGKEGVHPWTKIC